MLFWLKNTIYIIILLILISYLWINQDTLFSANNAETAKQAINSSVDKVKSISNSQSNPAAEGLSKFYANLRGDINGDGPRVRNNIVYLPEPKGDLVEILEARRLVIGPMRQGWRGNTENRAFRKGETLHQKLVEYINEEDMGIEVIWWLNRDFIVKNPFRIHKNLLDTAYRVGKAVEGHFQDGINVYFCYQQRNIVITDNPISYLTEECLLLPQK